MQKLFLKGYTESCKWHMMKISNLRNDDEDVGTHANDDCSQMPLKVLYTDAITQIETTLLL